MSNFKRKKVMLVGLVALALCVGVINNKLTEQRLLQTSADYVEYEGQMMQQYGETAQVVSSQTEDPAEQTWEEDEEVTLVSSDQYAELNDKTTYFEEARASLDMDRNEILSMLEEYGETSEDGQTRDMAEKEKLTLMEYMNQEKTIENLLRNKGFADAYVVITDNAVNVTINKEELTQEDIAKALDIVIRETGRPAAQVVIQNKM